MRTAPLPNGVARVPGAVPGVARVPAAELASDRPPGVVAASDVVAADHLGSCSGSGAVMGTIGWPSATEGASRAVVGTIGVPLLLSDLRERAAAAPSAVSNASFLGNRDALEPDRPPEPVCGERTRAVSLERMPP